MISFQNLRLKYKFSIIFLVMAMGFFALALVFGKVNDAQIQTEVRSDELKAFGDRVIEFSDLIADAQRNVRDFQLLDSLEFLQEFDAVITRARHFAAQIQTRVRPGEDAEMVERLQRLLEDYQNAFYQAAESEVTYGLTPSAGIRGDLLKTARELENHVKQADNVAIYKTLLDLRRHELNYFQFLDENSLKDFDKTAQGLQSALTGPALAALNKYAGLFHDAVAISSQVKREYEVTNAVVLKMLPEVKGLRQAKDRYETENDMLEDEERAATTRVFYGAMALTSAIVLVLLVFVALGVTGPVRRLAKTVNRLNEGDFDARTRLQSTDEVGEFSQALDKLLDDRVASLARAEKENKQLNASIVQLLRAVMGLSRHDLTVKVPVSEDVAGPIADALNMLSSELVKVLRQVTATSEAVDKTSSVVKEHAHKVMKEATLEGREVERTVAELSEAVDTMNNIAQLASNANATTEDASKITSTALESVTKTVQDINQIRGAIHETEKRIKRLGERTQEIGGAVKLIGNIAERTHFLALNASMHAASAGEAGRGFMVVADEVQRLAENSRDATNQIEALMKNMRMEMTDVVTTINGLISQVVVGTQMAELAGERMKETQKTTAELIASIQQIAANTQKQIETMFRLQEQARQVRQRSFATTQQLQEQSRVTDTMTERAKALLDAVRLFKLPAEAV